MVKELNHPKAGKIKVTGVPVKLSATPGAVLTAPPVLGQHTKEILLELGYSEEDIEQMSRDKIV